MHPDLLELLESLQSHSVDFLVVGSTALAVHARPRYTEDLDLWLRRTEENTHRLVAALQDFGFAVREDDFQRFWQQDRQMVTLGAKPQAVDLLNFMADDAFEDAWERRVEADLAGVRVAIIGLEDFVRAKRAAGRNKDLRDLDLLEEVHGKLP